VIFNVHRRCGNLADRQCPSPRRSTRLRVFGQPFWRGFVSVFNAGLCALLLSASGNVSAASHDGEHFDWSEGEAQPTQVGEISRHPTDMPRSADYRVYENGQFRERASNRSGPMTHEVHFDIQEVLTEVVKGTSLELWTFGGRIPGPMIRVRVGDYIDFHLHNPRTNRFSHNVDFHAVTGPGGGSDRLDTLPGSESRIKARLTMPGVYIYHCAFPDIPSHLSHGMYGLVVVEPEKGLPRVDHEYYLMQSEFYTEKGGGLAFPNLTGKGLLAFSGEYGNLEQPTFVVFNGRPEAIQGDRAIGVLGGPIRTGQTARFFVGNIGPNLASSFHMIGAMFNKVYVEGSFGVVNTDVQTTLIPSGGAVAVETKFEVPGDYPIIDHSIFRIHKGASATVHVEGAQNKSLFEPKGYSEGIR
jgi:nitrite reductase (NO-forming)